MMREISGKKPGIPAARENPVFSDNHVHFYIICLAGHTSDFLTGKCKSDFFDVGEIAKEPVIISRSIAQPVTGVIESQHGNNYCSDLIRAGRNLTSDRLMDMKSTFDQN